MVPAVAGELHHPVSIFLRIVRVADNRQGRTAKSNRWGGAMQRANWHEVGAAGVLGLVASSRDRP